MSRLLRTLLIALAVGCAGASPAAALSLDAAKSLGYLGERPDGLLGLVQADPAGEARPLMERINAQRLEKYRDLAGEQGVSVREVQVIIGEQLFDRAPTGTFLMNPDGTWRRK